MSFGAAIGALVPLILFGAGLWLLVKALDAKIIVLLVMFVLTFWLARSPAGGSVWHWLAGIPPVFGIHNPHL